MDARRRVEMIILKENIFAASGERKPLQRVNWCQRRQNMKNSFLSSTDSFNKFGFDYFDNDSNGLAYSGYRYDSRYGPVARKIKHAFNLSVGCKILEIGCAKGYLLKEMYDIGLTVAGIDISDYAVANSHPAIKSFLLAGDFSMPNISARYQDSSMDLIISKEVLPHMTLDQIHATISEIKRISRSQSSILLQIQVAESSDAKDKILYFDPTHITLEAKNYWIDLLASHSYEGLVHFKELF